MDQLQEADDSRNPKFGGAFRFYLKKGTSAHVVMLEDDPQAVLYEHTMRFGGNFDNFLCLGPGCPACASGDRPSLTSYFTVMLMTAVPTVDAPRYPNPEQPDNREWEPDWEVRNDVRRKSGALVLNPIQLLPAKRGTAGILRRQWEKRDGLIGALFEVSRSNERTSPAVGSIWDFEKKYDADELNILHPDWKPIDVTEELKAYNEEDLKALLVANSERGGGAFASDAPTAQAAPARKVGW